MRVSVAELGEIVVAASDGRPVRLVDVARLVDGPEEPVSYVTHGEPGSAGRFPAVTLSVSKRRGANAITVVRAIDRKLDSLRPRLFAAGVRTTVTRDYGETSAEKSNELLKHMAIATLSVALLMAFALGRREAGVVLLAVPVTLALTLFVFYIFGYTLNRITLFALIFSIGILVDDAIVVVENIVRHLRLPSSRGLPLARIAIEATDEVGNPTILATFAVIAAIVPMGFVGGLMGPYMRPIPVGASAAMLFSLLIAFAVSPWATRRLFRHVPAEKLGHAESERGRLAALYRRAMTPLVTEGGGRARVVFFAAIGVLLAAAVALVPLGVVIVKMLPFDNKNEFQIVVDFPEGTTLETTHRALSEMAGSLGSIPEVVGTEVYAGAAPVQLQRSRAALLPEVRSPPGRRPGLARAGSKRRRSSHAIARGARPIVEAIARRYAARVKVAEVPPGPPVLQTLVAEIYGPDDAGRREVARQVREVFSRTEGVADVDWYVESARDKVVFRLDREKAGLSGIHEADAAATLRLALGGDAAGEIQLPGLRERIPLVVTLPAGTAQRPCRPRGPVGVGRRRSAGAALGDRPIRTRTGGNIDLPQEPEACRLRHRRCRGTQGGAGLRDRSPREGNCRDPRAGRLSHPDADRGGTLRHRAVRPQVGRGVVRDVRSLSRPRPRVCRGARTDLRPGGRVVPQLHGAARHHGADPAHPRRHPSRARPLRRVLYGDLDDRFHRGRGDHRAQLDHPGRLHRAAARARAWASPRPCSTPGEVRFRPMLLTAAAVVVGSAVMLFDPIFQGLAVSMMAGEVAATLLSRAAVPVLYYLLKRSEEGKAASATGRVSLEPERSLP